MVAPRLRYHHHQGVRQRAPGGEKQFQRVVEAGGVALHALRYDGQQLIHIIAERVGLEHALARRHPVDVAAQSVYLAVVYHHAVRMRQPPCAERVGTEARMHQRERCNYILVCQIEIEVLKLRGVNQALVHNLVRGKAAHIEVIPLIESCFGNGVFYLPPNDIQIQIELEVAPHIRAAPDEELSDSGHDLGC